MVETPDKLTVEDDYENPLLPGEKISFHSETPPANASDEELNRRYAKGEVRIVTESARYSLAGILSMLKEKIATNDKSETEYRYRLDPEYQRRHRWSIDRKSRLIESFLMNVPVPPIFLYERELARYEVMDGRQRLTALKEFYDNQYKLEGLQYWPELNGRLYKNLPDKIRDGIDRRYISAIILLQETAPTKEQATKLKKIVFERLNSGGVKLEGQETRNAVYDGPLNQLCVDLSKNETFRKFWNFPDISPEEEDKEDENNYEEDPHTKDSKSLKWFKQMGDVELVLRFFAYRQLDSFPSGLNKMAEMLDRFIVEGNKFPEELLTNYRQMFLQTISFLSETLGESPYYRLDSSGNPQQQRNKIIYDPVMYVASQYAQSEQRNLLIENKDELLKQLGKMYKDNDNIFGGRKTNKSDAKKRNELMKQAFVDTIELIAKKGQ